MHVVGLGLIRGRSSTQLADFVRRSAELLAIILSYIVYIRTQKNGTCDPEKKQNLQRRSNRFVGSMMCLAGSIMAVLALAVSSTDKGNVVGGLVIALLGVTANSIFWGKYARLNKAEPNAILAVQARLYRAKTLVDAAITAALSAVLIAPMSPVAFWLDRIGSLVVAVYLVFCGVKTMFEVRK